MIKRSSINKHRLELNNTVPNFMFTHIYMYLNYIALFKQKFK